MMLTVENESCAKVSQRSQDVNRKFMIWQREVNYMVLDKLRTISRPGNLGIWLA